MTIHAFSNVSKTSEKWVAIPLELVDWMTSHMPGNFFSFLAHIDPFGDVLVPADIVASATKELQRACDELRIVRMHDLPLTVDLFGEYGQHGALMTIRQLIDLVSFAQTNDCKVVSVGD